MFDNARYRMVSCSHSAQKANSDSSDWRNRLEISYIKILRNFRSCPANLVKILTVPKKNAAHAKSTCGV